MFNLEYEKNKKISTEQMSMILDLAAQAASDGGFVSSYIFHRAAYVFAAQVLFPDKKETIAASIGSGYDIRLAFDMLVEDGTISEMQTKYAKEMTRLDVQADIWLDEVVKYQQSARGLLDSINTLSGDIVKSAAEQLQKAASGDAKVVQEFAEKWGFGRDQAAKTEAAEKKAEKAKSTMKTIDGDKK